MVSDEHCDRTIILFKFFSYLADDFQNLKLTSLWKDASLVRYSRRSEHSFQLPCLYLFRRQRLFAQFGRCIVSSVYCVSDVRLSRALMNLLIYLLSSCYLKLLTVRQTNKQTNAWQNITVHIAYSAQICVLPYDPPPVSTILDPPLLRDVFAQYKSITTMVMIIIIIASQTNKPRRDKKTTVLADIIK